MGKKITRNGRVGTSAALSCGMRLCTAPRVGVPVVGMHVAELGIPNAYHTTPVRAGTPVVVYKHSIKHAKFPRKAILGLASNVGAGYVWACHTPKGEHNWGTRTAMTAILKLARIAARKGYVFHWTAA